VARASKSDIVLLAVINCVWAGGWSALKYAQFQLGPVALNVWSLGISSLVLVPFAWSARKKTPGKPSRLSGRDYVDFLVMGLVALTGMTLLYNWGVSSSLAENGALVSMSVPMLTALIAVPVLREKMTGSRVLSLVLTLVGVIIISGIHFGEVKLFGPYLAGNLLLLAGAVGNAVYVVFGKRLLDRFDPMAVLFWGQVLGFLGSLPFLYLEPMHLRSVPHYTGYTWLALIFLGTIYFSFTMVIFYKILTRLDAGQIMVFTYLQPVFGVLIAHFVLHETLTVSMIIGGVLVIFGTLLVALEESASSNPEANPNSLVTKS
jgi:drug/metabolite transporter (DMT)-like permease